MNSRHILFATAIFVTGIAVGSAGISLVAPARADDVKWADIAEDPAFRAAVVEVINSCLVDNGIIYCN